MADVTMIDETSGKPGMTEDPEAPKEVVDGTTVKDEYGEYWSTLPGQLEHNKFTEGPFNVTETDGKKRLALIIRGESFREGRQHSRVVGSEMSIEEQKLASESHMNLIVKPFREAGYEVEIFLQTREVNESLTKMLTGFYGDYLTRMEMSDNLQSAYKPRKFNPETGKFTVDEGYTPQVAGSGLVNSWNLCLLNMARSLNENPRSFSHVMVIRTDEIFKVSLGKLLVEHGGKENILYANKHIVHGPDGRVVSEGNSPAGRHFVGDRWDTVDGLPSVSDQLHWFPFKYANVMFKVGFPGHQAWIKHQAYVGYDNLGFMIEGPFESDPSKAWNPLFKLAGRMEREPTEAELGRMPSEPNWVDEEVMGC